jgi:hypothetical protein
VRHKTIISLCAAIFVSSVPPSSAQDSPPPSADSPIWLPELEQQLQDDKSCMLLYLVNVREYQLGGRDVVEAKAQCEDGRSFDVSRQGGEPQFTIKLCKPVVC